MESSEWFDMQYFNDKNENRVIAIVEDDLAITTLLEYNFTKAGFMVVSFSNGDELLAYIKTNPIDILLLDWMLPGLSGIDICNRIRADREFCNIPIILISARCEEDDKVLGLNSGADDYLVKPFSVKELSARIYSTYRRANAAHNKEVLVFDDIQMDLPAMLVCRGQREIHLPQREFNILKLFMENPERVLSREHIIKRVWFNDARVNDINFIKERTVDVNINRLRNAIYNENVDTYQPLCTIRSLGYSLRKKMFYRIPAAVGG